METAGKGCADLIAAQYPQWLQGRTCILCGRGNNGGDGAVIARWLDQGGCEVVILRIGKGDLSPDAKANLELCRALGIPILQISSLEDLPLLEEIDRALAAADRRRAGGPDQKPDARPYLLLSLLLQTGIKKGEAMAIVPNHIDDSDPDKPVLYVRYANPRLRYKERKLPLETAWLAVLDEYLGQYRPTDTLFTCTARNLEYVLRDLAEEAELSTGALSFENLRWASAMRDWRADVEQDDIRQKLGLSKIAWRETKTKLRRLIEQEQVAA